MRRRKKKLSDRLSVSLPPCEKAGLMKKAEGRKSVGRVGGGSAYLQCARSCSPPSPAAPPVAAMSDRSHLTIRTSSDLRLEEQGFTAPASSDAECGYGHRLHPLARPSHAAAAALPSCDRDAASNLLCTCPSLSPVRSPRARFAALLASPTPLLPPLLPLQP